MKFGKRVELKFYHHEKFSLCEGTEVLTNIIVETSLVAQTGKNLPAVQGSGLILGSGRSPGEGNGNPLKPGEFQGLTVAWWVTVHGEAESWDLTEGPTSLAHGDTGNVLSSKTSKAVPIFSAFLQYQKMGCTALLLPITQLVTKKEGPHKTWARLGWFQNSPWVVSH